MKIISYNINGIKSFSNWKFIENGNFDFIALQEIRTNDTRLLDMYPPFKNKYSHIFWSVDTAQKGHAGVGILTRHAPLSVCSDKHSGRFIILEYKNFYFICAYFPHAGYKLEKLNYKINFIRSFSKIIQKLTKPVVLCGDINVAPDYIDVALPRPDAPDFTQQERDEFYKMCNQNDIVDTFRYLYPKKIKYTYFSKRTHAYHKMQGWRIDHFLVSHSLLKQVKRVTIRDDLYYSDHVPVILYT